MEIHPHPPTHPHTQPLCHPSANTNTNCPWFASHCHVCSIFDLLPSCDSWLSLNLPFALHMHCVLLLDHASQDLPLTTPPPPHIYRSALCTSQP